MKIRDKYGYPVEIVKGKYVKNFLRCLFIGNLRQTLKRRNQIIQVEMTIAQIPYIPTTQPRKAVKRNDLQICRTKSADNEVLLYEQ